MRSVRTLAALLAFSMPAMAGYGYKRTITIDHTKAGTANSLNFTVLVSGTYSYLAVVGSGGKIVNTVSCGVNSITCPADLIYTSDSACATPLSWEIESYTSATGVIVAWVKIASLAFASDTVIYECYGNAAVNTFQGGSAGAAFDASTLLVYHFAAGPSAKDSSASADHLVFANSPTSITGIIGAGGGFTPANIFTGPNATSTTTVPNTTNSTISGWVYFISFLVMDFEPIEIFTTNTAYPFYQISTIIKLDNTTQGTVYNDTQSFTSPASSAVTSGAWHFLTVTYDGATARYFVDAVAAGTVARSTTLNTASFRVNGQRRNNANFDELKLAATTRATSWITAEYNNQSSPSTFYAVGAEQPIGTNQSQALIF